MSRWENALLITGSLTIYLRSGEFISFEAAQIRAFNWTHPQPLLRFPYLPTDAHYTSEGGPYGFCSAFDCQPLASDLTSENNPSNACFFWSYKENRPNLPKSIPGVDFVPPPMICPHNLEGCYSKTYYDKGGKVSERSRARNYVVSFDTGCSNFPLFCLMNSLVTSEI